MVRIAEQTVAIKETDIRKNLEASRQTCIALSNVNISLAVVKPNNQHKPQSNIYMDLTQNRNIKIENADDYDNLVNYLQHAYNKYVAPMYCNFGKIGDVVSLNAEIDDACYFVDDEVTVGISISVPRDHQDKWQFYIIDRYAELSKFRNHLELMEFDVRDYRLQKVYVKFKFTMNENETVNYIKQNTEVDEELLAFWLASFNEIEMKRCEEKRHSHKIPIKIVDSEFGPVLEYCDETLKVKF